MTDYPISTKRCPWCLVEHNGAFDADDMTGGPPADGAISICIRCAGVSLFDETAEGGLRRPTDAERVDLADNDDVLRAIAAVEEINRRGYP